MKNSNPNRTMAMPSRALVKIPPRRCKSDGDFEDGVLMKSPLIWPKRRRNRHRRTKEVTKWQLKPAESQPADAMSPQPFSPWVGKIRAKPALTDNKYSTRMIIQARQE